jgi:hypothetical protein
MPGENPLVMMQETAKLVPEEPGVDDAMSYRHVIVRMSSIGA